MADRLPDKNDKDVIIKKKKKIDFEILIHFK
jgi:hypothetical protein